MSERRKSTKRERAEPTPRETAFARERAAAPRLASAAAPRLASAAAVRAMEAAESDWCVDVVDTPAKLAALIKRQLPDLKWRADVERAAAKAYGGGPPDLAFLAEARQDCFLTAGRLGVATPPLTDDPLLDIAALGERCRRAAGSGGKAPRRGRRAPPAKPITGKQAAAFEMIHECGGNVAEAGRRMGLNRKTVEQHCAAAMKKLGQTYDAAMKNLRQGAAKKHATVPLPADFRGQASVAGHDDGPAPSAKPPRGHVPRDHRRR
jgi:hypothetical protein